MKILDLLKLQKLKVSSYPHPLDERAAKWASEPEINSLSGFPLLEQSIPLDVDGKPHQVHVTILVGHEAVIFRGVDGQFWEPPILCFDGEALCSELLNWRERIELEPSLPSDAFLAALNDLAYKVEALSMAASHLKVI